MKKILTCLMLAAAMTATAQTTPNRMLVNHNWSYDGFAIDKVDSITFANVSGDVRADVTLQKFASGTSGDTVWVNVTRTASCESFSIDVISTVMANRYSTDGDIERLFAVNNSPKYYQNFTNGQMTGFPQSFEPGGSYTIITMGYDRYGVACQASRAEFTVPAKAPVGNPSVTWTVDETKSTEFTLTVTPNSDCKTFYWCEFGAGEADQQFKQWGPMFGFVTMGDMIKQFSGSGYTKTTTNTWNDLLPKHDYEVYILPTDANGTYGDMVIANITTAAAGGTGTAEMTITVGDFGGDATNGFYQTVTFTPNDQTGIHHDLLMTKAYYDANFTDAAITDSLKKSYNPWSPYDTYWDQVGVDEGRWNAETSTTYYALSLAQNANDEWGPLAKVEFTTPASASSAKAYNTPVAERIALQRTKQNATAPAGKSIRPRLVQTAK